MISEIRFRPLNAGALSGQLAYVVRFNAGPWDLDEGTEAIYAVRHHNCGQNKTIVLVDEGGSYDDTGILTFLKTLKDNGYWIVVHTGGALYRQWYGQANWITLIAEEGPFAGFAVNDASVLYQPGMPEPDFPHGKIVPLLYLTISEANKDSAMEFIVNAKRPWKVERTVIASPERVIYPQEEKS